MTGLSRPLPVCSHCHAEVGTIKVGPEGHQLWFVMCGSDECASKGLGRPLSDGKPTKQEAEDNWCSTSRPNPYTR